MFRNLMMEFKGDQSISPLDIKRKTLGDDWVYTRFISPNIAAEFDIAPELLRVQLRFVLDAPHKLSSITTDTPGRIIYICLPEIRGSRVHELSRGVSLGESYDFARFTSDKDLMGIVYQLYKSVLMSPDDYESHVKSLTSIGELKSGAGHPARANGSYAFENIGGRRTLVWISDETKKAREDHYEQVTARAERRAMLYMVRGIIREHLTDDDFAIVMESITKVMSEQGDEDIVTEALKAEMKSLQIRMERKASKSTSNKSRTK